MPELLAVDTLEDILPQYRDTPVGALLEYHNLERPLDPHATAKLLVGMCMDNRTGLRIPENFAFVLRTSGANMRHNEFRISFAIAVGGIQAIALVAHTNCGMVNLNAKHERFVRGMVENAGWDEDRAEQHFLNYAAIFEIDDEVSFVVAEAARLRSQYPRLQIAPLLYRVEDHRLYQIVEDQPERDA